MKDVFFEDNFYRLKNLIKNRNELICRQCSIGVVTGYLV